MPIFLEPDCIFPVYLDSDKSKPEEIRPTFLAKSQSMRGQKLIGNTLDRIIGDTEATLDELFEDIINVLMKVLTGWRNMGGVEFCRDGLWDVLSYSEAREILRKVAYNQHVTADEKKS